jgi:hypothetical protein
MWRCLRDGTAPDPPSVSGYAARLLGGGGGGMEELGYLLAFFAGYVQGEGRADIDPDAGHESSPSLHAPADGHAPTSPPVPPAAALRLAGQPHAAEWHAVLSQLADSVDASVSAKYGPGAAFGPCEALRRALRKRRRF